MIEFYSSGQHGEVYRLTGARVFPHSEVVKKEADADRYWFLRLFYRQRIGSLLFPDNFIEVVGTQVFPSSNGVMLRTHSLFSKEAKVNQNHAEFSNHTTWSEKLIETFDPTGPCTCERCVSHRNFHRENKLGERALEISKKMEAIGIKPPVNDQTDYCLGERGQVIFFEMLEFDPQKLRRHLAKLKKPTDKETEALKLLDRHDLSVDASKNFVKSYAPGLVEVRNN